MQATTERELIDAMKALGPLLKAHAVTAEQQRKPVDEVMQAIEATGAYRWFVPKKYGGFEFSLTGFMEVGLTLGAACTSHAWVTTFCMEHNWLLSLFPQAAQDDLFGSHPYIIAPGALAPKGKAVPVDGGFRITGQWQWGTGVMHANWVMVGAMSPVEGRDAPMLAMYLLPIDEVEVLDTWYVQGMVGTGSNDIVVNDVFVPAHRCIDISLLRDGTSPGAQFHKADLYRMPMLPVLGLTAAAPLVGAAQQAVDVFAENIANRTVYGTTTKQQDKAVVQSRLAQARVEVQSIGAQLMQLAHEVQAWGARDEACPELERARLRVALGHVVRRARDVVRDIVEASGASAHFLHNPLQRILRDLNTASCHTVFDLDVSAENYGRMLVGLAPNGPV
ncbi:MAG: acyl-CoA dehydrogenase [Gammaproteobacteria bacterium]|jgi:3-hydroxy-9,10-secoandrosta-1,3,5(10)-triene-9,17-dione monooxygenase|nr:acyl-CoA dehydrogenase [Gammaproteobacteria bacterium]